MSQLHKFKVEPIDELGRGKVTIDDKPIRCRGYELRHYVDEVPSVEIEIACLPQIEETASISVLNKEEIAELMDKDEFEEFCKIWERLHETEIPTETLIRLGAGIGSTEALKKFGIEIDLSKPETIAQLRNAFTDTCDTNPNCNNDHKNCGYAVEYSTFEDVGNGIHKYMCGRDKCKYCK